MSINKTTLYKYVDTKYLSDILKNSRLYLSDGRSFNDPFELKIANKKTETITHIEGLHILCLTNSFRKKLMWSHYANSHKGVCLTIEVPSHLVYPVCYTSERLYEDSDIDKIIDKSLKNGKKNLVKSYNSLSVKQKSAYIKDAKWKYEKEYRIVFDKEEGLIIDNNKYYMSVKIKNVYLGANFDIEDINMILNICKEKNISIKKMILSNNKYSLQPKEL